MARLTVISLLVFTIIFLSLPTTYAADKIKLHIFLHSHMDEGWLYTFEKYYTGSGSQDGGCVKCIFDNTYQSLLAKSSRKYQIAETAFFKRWWKDQPDATKNNYRRFIRDKQVEFINGGWSATDEACSYYEDLVDNFILGHRWLNDEFGVDPNIGWQIDSFGHSATVGALMAQAGYDAFFFGRIDYQDWEKRRDEKSLETIWRTENPHNETLVGRILYVHYSDTKFMIPENYNCRSIFCYGPLDPGKYSRVAEWVKEQSKSFRTNNIAMLVGDDFHLWQQAEKDFNGIEEMIKYYKEHPEMNIEAKFSSLSEYMAEMTTDYKAAHKEPLPSKYGDFFPYIENEWTSWVGYFTSKSMFKLKIRQMSQYYNAAKILIAKYMLQVNRDEAKLTGSAHKILNDALFTLEDPLGVVQHHDAISGTCREAVKHDYERMLDTGRKNIDKEIVSILQSMSTKMVDETPQYAAPLDFDWRQRDQLITQIFTENKKVLVNVFNPGEKDKFLIKIKVPNYKYKVMDDKNNYLLVDIICNNAQATEDCFIYFVDEIFAYSLKNYIVLPSALSKRVLPTTIDKDLDLQIGNQVTFNIGKDLRNIHYRLCPKRDQFDLDALFEDLHCVEDNFDLNYEYYRSDVGHGGTRVASGAYIFNPRTETKASFSNPSSGRVFQGRHVTIVQISRDEVRTDIKLVHHQLELGLEVESFFEPVYDENQGKEIVMMLRSKHVLNHENIFYTDDNGYYMQRRQLNHRDDFKPKNNVPIPSNYYPITSAVYIEDSDSKLRLTISTDRSQGVTSLKAGEVEIMVHRLTISDDWKGLSETVRELDPEGGMLRVATRHYISYSSPDYDLKKVQRIRQYKLDRQLQFWFANIQNDRFEKPRPDWDKDAERLDLPNNVKLYIRSYKLNEYVVRFHNLDLEKSKTVPLYDLKTKVCSLLNDLSLREDIKVVSVTELSLFTHKNKDQIKKNQHDPLQPDWKNVNDGPELSTIELVPMEMRTFNIVIEK